MRILLSFTLAVSILTAGQAPTVAQHKAFMDSMQDLRDGLEDSLPGSPDQTVSAAMKLLESLRKERQFWEDAHVAEGVRLATQSIASVTNVKTAVAARNPAKMRASFAAVTASCVSCHDAHLEQWPHPKP